MKIFNWVHTRFNNTKARKNAPSTYHDDQEYFNATSAFDCWKGGILSIGTFGYDPLKDEKEAFFYEEGETSKEQPKEYESDDHVTEEEEEEEEEMILMEKIEVEYMMLDKDRTTLADLFFADEELKKEKRTIIILNEKAKVHDDDKKKIGVDDGRPIPKLQQMMRKMLKRKVYPHH